MKRNYNKYKVKLNIIQSSSHLPKKRSLREATLDADRRSGLARRYNCRNRSIRMAVEA